MAAIDWLVTAGTLASGAVSTIVLVSIVVDAVTRGWVRRLVQSWLGITGLREDHRTSQVFIIDLAQAYNGLMETVCEENDIPEEERPDKVKTTNYEWMVTEETELDAGDFLRGGSEGDD